MRRKVIGAFTQRIGLKLTAVALAIVVWFIVSAKEPTMQWVSVRFQPELDSTLVLRGQPPDIRVLVAGEPSMVLQLSGRPPVIRRQLNADTPDTVVVDLSPTDVELPEGIADAIVVRDIQPRSITLRFEPTWMRRVAVRPVVEVNGDTTLLAMADPEVVEISGPRLAVLRTRFVRTERLRMSAADSLPHLVLIDTAGLGLRVRPTQVTIRLGNAPRAAANGVAAPGVTAGTTAVIVPKDSLGRPVPPASGSSATRPPRP